MSARVLHLPVPARPRSQREDARLDAALEWLLSEITEPLSIGSLRAIATRELEAPRDELHRLWAQTFLSETKEYF